ncbi:MAG: cohesin domain-containing protein [Dehalococcoidia bacterium]
MFARHLSLRAALLSILFAASLLVVLAAGRASAEDPSLAIDTGTMGNSGSGLGDLEDCISVDAGDTFDIDVLILDVTDLLAWELSLDYDAAVLTVVDHDVKMFQSANEGSSPVDISAKLPDDSGSHTLSAFESSDPLTPDSGSGVLARVTLEATASGETELRFGERDANGDGTIDRGTLLKDVNAEPIGDTTDDGFFDGQVSSAIAVVGDDCPDGYTVASIDSQDTGSSADGWVYAAAGAFALGCVLIAGVLLRSRRRRPD